MDLDAIFDDVFPSLYRYCHRLTGDGDLAEDVAQEAFIRLVERNVEGPRKALRVWLFKVATNLVRDRHRVSDNRRRLLGANPPPTESEEDPARSVERREVVEGVRRVLRTLPERDRSLLLMREEGFSYHEMADAVDVKSTSVGTLLARAEKRFAEAYLENQGPHGAGREDHDSAG